MNSNLSYHPEILKWKTNRQFFTPCNLEVWPMTLKNNKAPLLCYFKLCASFQNHQCIQTGVTVWKHSIWVKIGDFFLSCVTLNSDRWPWKTTGHLFYATSSFVHHFKTISEFKLELQSGSTQFGSKLAICVLCDLEIWWMILKNKAPVFYATSSFIYHFATISEFKQWIYSPEMPKLGRNLFWPLTLTSELLHGHHLC